MRCSTQARHSRRRMRRCSRTRRCTRHRPSTRRTRSFCSASVSVPTPSSRPCNSSNSNRCLSTHGRRRHPLGPRRRQQLPEQLGRRHRLPVPHPSVRPEAAPHRHFRRQGNRYHSQPDSRELGSLEEARLDRPRPRAEEAVTAVVAELVAQGHRHRLDRSVAGSALVARRGRQAHPAHLEAGSAEAGSPPALRAGEAVVMHRAAWATCPSVRRSTTSPRTDCVRPRRR